VDRREGEEDKAGNGEGTTGEGRGGRGGGRWDGGSGRVSRRAGKDRRKPGTSRFCYDQWRTGTQRALFVSIRGKEGESERGTLVGLSVECLSLPGSPHPSSARILRLPRFSEASRRAGPRRIFLLFVRFIARPLCLPSFFSFFSSSPRPSSSPPPPPAAAAATAATAAAAHGLPSRLERDACSSPDTYSSQNSMTRIREIGIPDVRGVNDRHMRRFGR